MRSGDNREKNSLTRGMILKVLCAQAELDKGDLGKLASYADEALIWSMVTKRYPQSRAIMRAQLTYLKDRGYVLFHEVKVAGESSLLWRITDKGTDLLEGSVPDDPGVTIE